MSIIKTIVQPSGVTTSFHRIDAITSRFDGTGNMPITSAVEVGSYLDQASAESGKHPVARQTLSITLATEPNLAMLYEWLVAPMVYVNERVPALRNIDGVLTPDFEDVQKPITPITGFNGATLA